MGFAAKVIADSINPYGKRLITFEATFPRYILAEVNTHRALSKNSASSRAIPVRETLKRVTEDPFIPIDAAWQKNQKGMQGGEPLSREEREVARGIWLDSRNFAIESVKRLTDPDFIDLHKGIANRLLEPFMWHTAIISGTERMNFFNLRAHKDADVHFQTIARMLVAAERKSTPKLKQVGEWHLPYVEGEGFDYAELKKSYDDIEIARISSARCARVSYLTHNKTRDPQEDLALAKRLQEPVLHASPFEHAAQVADKDKPSGNFTGGWAQYRKRLPNEAVFVGFDAMAEVPA